MFILILHHQLSELRKKNNSNRVAFSIEKILQSKPDDWKNILFNDFEEVVFKQHPEIKQLKDDFYKHGSLFSLMSGSGSAVYAFFRKSDIIYSEKKDFLKKTFFIKNL